MLSFTRQNCTIQRISQRNFCFGFGVDGEGGDGISFILFSLQEISNMYATWNLILPSIDYMLSPKKNKKEVKLEPTAQDGRGFQTETS